MRYQPIALNNHQPDRCITALCAELITGADGAPPQWIELLPDTPQVVGRDGRSWKNSRPADLVSAYNTARTADIPVDWEHATHKKAPQGDPAPASGWVVELALNGQHGVNGRIEWTPSGATSVTSREYRYISPAFRFDPATGEITSFLSVGLTNKPNLELPALNAEHHDTKEESMDFKLAVLAALGIAATATDTDALNAINTLKADRDTALNSAANPPLDKFVPKADYDLALNRATDAEGKLAEQAKTTLETAINTEIDAALAAGKITPATKDYHIAQCRQDGGLDRFKTFCQAAPVVGADTNLSHKKPGESDAELNAEELAIIESMGISAEDHKKFNNIK